MSLLFNETYIYIWRRIQLLAGMSSSLWQFSPESNRTFSLLSWRDHHYPPSCEFFLSKRRHSNFLRSVQFGWKEKSLFMEKIVLVATTRTQKETSNTFDSCIIKLFQLERDRERKKDLICLDVVRGTTKDPLFTFS